MNDHTRPWDEPPATVLTRLREQPGGDLGKDAAWAVDLLRDAPAHRLKPGERQRVLLGLGRARVATRRPWAVRLAATVAVLIAATAIARAGLGHFPRWLEALSRDRRATPPADARPVSNVIRHRARTAASAVPTPEIAAPAASPIADAPAPLAPAPVPPPARATRPTVTAKQPARRPVLPAAKGDDDAGLVVQAMRALRRDHDPALARALSASYLERHPDGALAEEALALTIEAAVAQHDPGAAALGGRYLRRYPNGPFRGLARHANRSSGADSR
jgi:hypothetical protein